MIKSAQVNPNSRIGNPPELAIELEAGTQLPELNEFRFEMKEMPDGHILYFAHLRPWVNYYAENPSNRRGYGGHVFPLHMTDGSVREVEGPWSSRSSYMNQFFEPHSFEVVVNLRRVAAMDVEMVRDILARFAPNWELADKDKWGEPGHELRLRGHGFKDEDREAYR